MHGCARIGLAALKAEEEEGLAANWADCKAEDVAGQTASQRRGLAEHKEARRRQKWHGAEQEVAAVLRKRQRRRLNGGFVVNREAVRREVTRQRLETTTSGYWALEESKLGGSGRRRLSTEEMRTPIAEA
ncbi:hypothetical protein M0R45_009000 [Rubus argutus]|uniref:Uncharacterized protein n=1 Tax=Rubus argutus TaxID=59490 RepID=A0AAW1Y4L8_RUBAR